MDVIPMAWHAMPLSTARAHRQAPARRPMDDGGRRCETRRMTDSPADRPWLDDALLEQLYEATVRADLVDRGTRAVLLQGLPDARRLALPDHERPDVQFRSDLRQLNLAGADGTAPLRSWLAEARALAAGRPEEAVFAEAAARPDLEPVAEVTRPAVDPEVAVEPPPGSGRPAWLVPVGVAGMVVVGVIAVIAGGGGPDPGPDASTDAQPVDMQPIDAAALPPVEFPTTIAAPATDARPALRRVPAGQLGLDDGFGQRRMLTVAAPLLMSAGPITRGQYAAVTGVEPPARTAPDPIDPRPIVRPEPGDPATGVTLAQARAYCDALSRREGLTPFYAGGGAGYRLPTEAAWVMACTAGGTSPAEHPWGARPGDAVREWSDERFSTPGPGGAAVVAPGAGQAVRGAGRPLPADEACRVRSELNAGEAGSTVGFRVMRPAQ